MQLKFNQMMCRIIEKAVVSKEEDGYRRFCNYKCYSSRYVFDLIFNTVHVWTWISFHLSYKVSRTTIGRHTLVKCNKRIIILFALSFFSYKINISLNGV